MALFGLIKAGEGHVSITLPEWMSKEMIEMFIGSFAGGMLAGAVSGIVKSAGKLSGIAASMADVAVNGIISFMSYRLAAKGQFKNYAFGSMIVTGFMTMTGLINLILRSFTAGAQMAPPWEAHSIGESVVVKVFGHPKVAPSATATIIAKPQPVPIPPSSEGAEIY